MIRLKYKIKLLSTALLIGSLQASDPLPEKELDEALFERLYVAALPEEDLSSLESRVAKHIQTFPTGAAGIQVVSEYKTLPFHMSMNKLNSFLDIFKVSRGNFGELYKELETLEAELKAEESHANTIARLNTLITYFEGTESLQGLLDNYKRGGGNKNKLKKTLSFYKVLGEEVSDLRSMLIEAVICQDDILKAEEDLERYYANRIEGRSYNAFHALKIDEKKNAIKEQNDKFTKIITAISSLCSTRKKEFMAAEARRVELELQKYLSAIQGEVFTFQKVSADFGSWDAIALKGDAESPLLQDVPHMSLVRLEGSYDQDKFQQKSPEHRRALDSYKRNMKNHARVMNEFIRALFLKKKISFSNVYLQWSGGRIYPAL